MSRTIKEKIVTLTELEEELERKTAIVRRLILHKDKVIDQELHKDEEALFYFRLQSQCFNLYPLLTRLLLHMIDDSTRRTVFSAIINGKDIYKLAEQLSMTPESVGNLFCTTVRGLSKQTSEMFEYTWRYEKLVAQYRSQSALLRAYKGADYITLAERVKYLENYAKTLEDRYRKERENVIFLNKELEQLENETKILKQEKRLLEWRIRDMRQSEKSFFKKLKDLFHN
ncbi:hypothetical protein [Bacteroides sp.]